MSIINLHQITYITLIEMVELATFSAKTSPNLEIKIFSKWGFCVSVNIIIKNIYSILYS